MKKSLLVVIALLAMASLMAAMAFTSASLRNTAAFTVKNTNEALLAIEAGNHNAAGYSTNGRTSNHLVIDWAKGFENESFGVQKGSLYIWEKLFKVTNNSENSVLVKIKIPFDSKSNKGNIGSTVSLKTEDSNDWTVVAKRNSKTTDGIVEFTLEPGQEMWIDSKIDSVYELTSGMSLANGNRNLNIMVDAEIPASDSVK